jgi:diaminopimelate epimerase
MITVDKYHGTGNDFVVVDAAADVPDRRAFARAVCDRETGIEGPDGGRIGADGVLFLAVDADETPPRAEMTLVQPDGSVAAMCGNGARCAATWVHRRLRAAGSDADGAGDGGGPAGGGDPDAAVGEVILDTPAGDRPATIHADGSVTVGMGRASFAPADVPLAADRTEPLVEEPVAGLTVTAVNTGVPHAVALVEDVDDVDLAAVAPPVRHADVFPEGANVTLAARVAGEGDEPAYRQRTFERGVEGETRSCGTGAVAVAAVAARLGAVEAGEPVDVSPPGGTLTVTAGDGGSAATLRGPVAFEFSAEVDERAGRERAPAGTGGPAEPGE